MDIARSAERTNQAGVVRWRAVAWRVARTDVLDYVSSLTTFSDLQVILWGYCKSTESSGAAATVGLPAMARSRLLLRRHLRLAKLSRASKPRAVVVDTYAKRDLTSITSDSLVSTTAGTHIVLALTDYLGTYLDGAAGTCARFGRSRTVYPNSQASVIPESEPQHAAQLFGKYACLPFHSCKHPQHAHSVRREWGSFSARSKSRAVGRHPRLQTVPADLASLFRNRHATSPASNSKSLTCAVMTAQS